jgi:hypothetical protein
MIQISNLLNQIDKSEKKRITNERQNILSMFVEEINKERPCTYLKNGKKVKLGLITGKGVAMKCSHIKDNSTLYYFYSQCLDYKNRKGSFSKCFFGGLKTN